MQVGGRVECELVCASSSGCHSISSTKLWKSPIEYVRTEKSNYDSRPCEDAHGSNVLLAERVLHTGEDGTDGGGLQHGVAGVVEGIPGVVCWLLVGHGGRNGCDYLVLGALDIDVHVVEVGSGHMLGAANARSVQPAVGTASSPPCMSWIVASLRA